MQTGQPRSRALTLPRPCLMLVTEPMEPSRLIPIVRAAVAGGVNIVQLRDRDATTQQIEETAAALKSLLPETLFLVNARSEIACAAGYDGVHLPEYHSDPRQARLTVGPNRLVGRSVHSLDSAVEAQAQGADYLVAGTIFASASHPGEKPAGPEFLRRVCAEVSRPVLAIGGVTPENVAGCMQAGAAGVAVLSPIMRAADPYGVARRYRAALDRDRAGQAGCEG